MCSATANKGTSLLETWSIQMADKNLFNGADNSFAIYHPRGSRAVG